DRRGDAEGEALGLRFDLTVPLARVVAQYADLPRPFRRYQVAPVWRADKPDRGRFREFVQFDIDSVGVASEIADVEIIAAMCDTLSALAVGGYKVRFSSRKILNLLLAFAELPAEFELTVRGEDALGRPTTRTERRASTDVFRVLDKLDKIGRDKARRELTTGYTDESGDRVPGLGLTDAQVDRIEAFLAIRSDRRDDVLAQLRELLAPVDGAQVEIDVLADMSRRLAMLGYGDDRVQIDLSIARGLAYYTGPVYEAVLDDAPQFGSVFGGGRYDELVTPFTGQKIPATGASIGVDRQLAAQIELGRAPLKKCTAQVLVTSIDPNLMDDYLAITFELRRAGIPAELFVGSKNIGKQMKYADQQGVPIALMYGGDEKARGVVTLKDLAAGRAQSGEIDRREDWIRQRPGQIEAPRAGLVSAVRKMLSAGEA
ncbi:MAG: histidine--tRNA ligase, partial [Chloroflexi bacterium]|nr:histidine--tRNA ligase [Chloroflexota bacterium]